MSTLFRTLINKAGVCLLLALALASSARAWPPTYGAEFEFTNPEMIAAPGVNGPTQVERDAAKNFAERMRARCEVLHCKVEDKYIKWGSEYAVTFENGWWFKISYDPGCVEIMTKPSTLAELREKQPLIEDAIFGTAKTEKLHANFYEGAGHFNFGAIATFGDDSDLFLRYFMDFANHPELASGILGNDFVNAPPLGLLEQAQRDALDKIVHEFHSNPTATIPELAKQIQKSVYYKTVTPGDAGYHYQAMSIKKLNQSAFPQTDAPMENRGVYPQTSLEDFIMLGEILEARVAFLKTQKGQAIDYRKLTRTEFGRREMATRFYIYLTEAGLSWSRYEKLLPRELQHLPLAEFISKPAAWKTGKYVSSVRQYMSDIPYSPWIREKMLEAFMDEEAAISNKAAALLRDLMKADAETPEGAKATRGFVLEVLSSEHWMENLGKWEPLRKEIESIDPSMAPEIAGAQAAHVLKRGMTGECEALF